MEEGTIFRKVIQGMQEVNWILNKLFLFINIASLHKTNNRFFTETVAWQGVQFYLRSELNKEPSLAKTALHLFPFFKKSAW